LMIDIDHFKQINDSLGHSAGDEALRQVANACRDNLRQVDLICRYGGEEFVCLLPETSLANAAQTAERLRRCIEILAIQTHHHQVHLTVSIGVTCNFQPELSLQEMIDHADMAMYAAKQAGRNSVKIYRS